MRSIFACIVLLSIAYGCTIPSSESRDTWRSSPELSQIYQLKDRGEGSGLIPFLQNPQAEIRAKAAWALGSVQDTNFIDPLLALLDDQSGLVREMAAFAIGQTGYTAAEAPLLLALQKEHVESVKYRIAEAIGKCATDLGIDYITALPINSTGDQQCLAVAIYRASLKRNTSAKATQSILQLLASSDDEHTLSLGLDYLRRAAVSLEPAHQASLKKLISSPHWTVRMKTIGLLGAYQTEVVEQLIRETKLQAIIATFQTFATRHDAMIQFAAQYIRSPKAQIAIPAAQYLARTATEPELQTWMQDASLSPQVKAQILSTAAGRSPSLQALADTTAQALYLTIANTYDRQALLQAIHGIPFLVQQLETSDSLASAYIVERLTQLITPQTDPKLVTQTVQLALQSSDVAQLYHIGSFLQTYQSDTLQQHIMTQDLIPKAMSTLSIPRDIEAYWELQKLIAKYTQTTPKLAQHQPTQSLDMGQLSSYPAQPVIVLETDQGDIHMELDTKEAPSTSLMIMQLVSQGFYDGKVFHRVIPNFVAQGGCPFGNGFGGLDQTIRSELSTKTYQTGSVGMASAGKDTESCQFFISLAPTPHLDGRYTRFAQVTSGLDIALSLGVGSKIHKAYLKEQKAEKAH